MFLINYFNLFKSIPHQNRFLFKPNFWILFNPVGSITFWLYIGNKWQGIVVSRWSRGYSILSYRWVKQVAIFKKKTVFKKKKIMSFFWKKGFYMNNMFIRFVDVKSSWVVSAPIVGFGSKLLQFLLYRLEIWTLFKLNLLIFSSITNRYIFYLTVSLLFPVFQSVRRQYSLHLNNQYLLKLRRGVSFAIGKSFKQRTRSSPYFKKRSPKLIWL